jgi:hypothetical protein
MSLGYGKQIIILPWYSVQKKNKRKCPRVQLAALLAFSGSMIFDRVMTL